MRLKLKTGMTWAVGYLRYGHYEGFVKIPDEDYEKFKADPIAYYNEYNLDMDMQFSLDDYDLNDMGDVDEIEWEAI